MKTKHLKAAVAAVSLLIASGPALASVLWSRVSAETGLAWRGLGSRLRASGVVVLLAVLAVLAGSLPAGALPPRDEGGGDPPPVPWSHAVAWGWNGAGQLGDGTLTGGPSPVDVADVERGFTQVAAGARHSLAVAYDGTVWAWGNNRFGQLGDSTTFSHFLPRRVWFLTGVVAVSAGEDHSLALRSDGTVWAWGKNNHGQLGPAVAGYSWPTPVQVTRLANITRVASARDFNYAVRSDGTVWAWGSNYLGTLGNGLTSGSFTPQRIQALTGIGAVAAGKSHGLAVSFTGAVWAWGYNNDGQLGDGTTVMRPTPVQIPGLGGIVSVAAGESHSLAVQSNGAMWGWGSNYHGQVGDGTIAGHWSPVPGVLTGVLAIAAGKRHSVALRSDGTIWTWGANYLGQLGDGTTAGRVMPAQVPGVAAATRIASGSLAEHTLIVRAVPRPGFQIAMGFESGTVPAGRSLAVPLTVKRVNGYAGQVALSVASLLSSVTASISPTVLTDGQATLTLTADTQATPSHEATVVISAVAEPATQPPTVASATFTLLITDPVE